MAASVSLHTFRPPHLGRELVCKESKKNFKATVAMSQDFPLGIESYVHPFLLRSILQRFLHRLILGEYTWDTLELFKKVL